MSNRALVFSGLGGFLDICSGGFSLFFCGHGSPWIQFVCNKCKRPLQKAGATTSLCLNAEFFDMGQQIGGIVVDAVGAGPFQLFLGVAAA